MVPGDTFLIENVDLCPHLDIFNRVLICFVSALSLLHVHTPQVTGIGRKNMPSFQAFVALVFICLIMDILLLTAAV